MGNLSSVQSAPDDWPWVWAIRDVEVLDWKRNLSNEDILRTSTAQALPVEIMVGLYLGSAKEASDLHMLESFGITHVVNAAGDRQAGPRGEYADRGIEYLQLDGEDEEGYPMLDRHLQAAREFIGPARRTGRVLVHCAAGLNRSGVLVAAERMLSTRETVLETVAHCRRARGNMVLCNESFQEQLVALARADGRLGPAPGRPGSVVPETPSPPGAARERPAARSALDRL